MKTYTVMFTTTASTVLSVDAESTEEARELADEKFEGPSLCAHCSGWGNSQNLDLGDWEQDESESGVWS